MNNILGKVYANIMINGTYYNWVNSNGKKVKCCRCDKNGLRTSIGIQQYHLCLDCVSELDKIQPAEPQESITERYKPSNTLPNTLPNTSTNI